MNMQWNAGGWFGAQLGGTAWMLVAAVLSAVQNLPTGLITLGIFLLPNLVGTVFWLLRDGISCYHATQILVLIIGLFGAMAVYVLDRRELWEPIQTGGTASASFVYGVLILVTVGLMGMFYLKAGRKSASPDS